MLVRCTRGAALTLAGATLAVAACGGGSGPLVTTGSSTRDDPGTTRDTPPATADLPGGPCIQCGVSYRCTSTDASNGNRNQNVEVPPSMCTPAAIDLVCSGAVFQGGAPCTGGGGGPFTCGSVTCVPEGAQPSPQPPSGQGGGGGTVTVDAG